MKCLLVKCLIKKYLRTIILLTLTFGSGYTQFAHAYLDVVHFAPLEWERAINRDTGDEVFALYTEPQFNIRFEFNHPVSSGTPLTVSKDTIEIIYFFDNPLVPKQVTGGLLFNDFRVPPVAAEVSIDFELSSEVYGNYLMLRGDGTCNCDRLILHDDDYQFRGEGPYPATAFYKNGPWDEWMTISVNLPEPYSLPLLVMGLVLVAVRGNFIQKR